MAGGPQGYPPWTPTSAGMLRQDGERGWPTTSGPPATILGRTPPANDEEPQLQCRHFPPTWPTDMIITRAALDRLPSALQWQILHDPSIRHMNFRSDLTCCDILPNQRHCRTSSTRRSSRPQSALFSPPFTLFYCSSPSLIHMPIIR